MPARKVLLDECVDSRLAKEIVGHEVSTVPGMKWSGIKNGKLLALAQASFDVFVTVDRNLAFQQNLPAFTIAVVVLQAKTNRLEDLLPLVPQLLLAIENVQPGAVLRLGG